MTRLSQQAVARVLNRMSQNMKVVAAITDYQAVTPTLARVVISTSVESTREDLSRAVAKVLDGKAMAVPGSFRRVQSSGSPAYYGYVKLNRQVRAMTEDDGKHMKALASNLLMDKDDQSLWEVTAGPNGQKMLARKTRDDLTQLLQTAKVYSVRGAPVLASISTAPAVREFAAFMDPEKQAVRFGYVVAADQGKITVVPNTALDGVYADAGVTVEQDPGATEGVNDSPEEKHNRDTKGASGKEQVVLDTAMLIESAYVAENDADMFKDFQIPNTTEGDKLKYYFQKLYSYSPEAKAYYQMIADQIDQHAAL